MDHDCRFKVLLIGNYSVGKSSLLVRFADGMFHEDTKSTIGVDFRSRTVPSNGIRVKLDLFDTSGQEQFKAITASFYRGADAIVLVYDVTDRKSFVEIPKWLDHIEKNASSKSFIKMLVGNKCDLERKRQVETYEARSLAAEYKMNFCECSARRNLNVDQIFLELSHRLRDEAAGARHARQPTGEVAVVERRGFQMNTCCS